MTGLEKRREATRKWVKENPEKSRQSKRRWRENNRGYQREWWMKYNHNLSVSEWETLFESQERRCAICNVESFQKFGSYWHTDHCHKTGEVRGILCPRCNLFLGAVEDNISILYKMIEYLGNTKDEEEE